MRRQLISDTHTSASILSRIFKLVIALVRQRLLLLAQGDPTVRL